MFKPTDVQSASFFSGCADQSNETIKPLDDMQINVKATSTKSSSIFTTFRSIEETNCILDEENE